MVGAAYTCFFLQSAAQWNFPKQGSSCHVHVQRSLRKETRWSTRWRPFSHSISVSIAPPTSPCLLFSPSGNLCCRSQIGLFKKWKKFSCSWKTQWFVQNFFFLALSPIKLLSFKTPNKGPQILSLLLHVNSHTIPLGNIFISFNWFCLELFFSMLVSS